MNYVQFNTNLITNGFIIRTPRDLSPKRISDFWKNETVAGCVRIFMLVH